MKTWKAKEIELTEWLSEAGIWDAVRMSRALRGEEVEDIAWGPISVELKTRKDCPPRYMLDWMQQCSTNAEGKVPVVVHRDRMKMGQQLCVLTLNDLIDLLFWAIRKGEGDASTDSDGTEGHGTPGEGE